MNCFWTKFFQIRSLSMIFDVVVAAEVVVCNTIAIESIAIIITTILAIMIMVLT